MERDYRILSAPDADVGGVMPSPDGARFGPLWLGYVGVEVSTPPSRSSSSWAAASMSSGAPQTELYQWRRLHDECAGDAEA